jgi:flagellar protein FlbD
MIIVHRLRGEPMLLNADLIETIEATPDTVITLVDGRRVVVADGTEDIVESIIRFRASLLAAAGEIRSRAGGQLIDFPGRMRE